jgi:hypothetical protein
MSESGSKPEVGVSGSRPNTRILPVPATREAFSPVCDGSAAPSKAQSFLDREHYATYLRINKRIIDEMLSRQIQ